MVQLRLHDSQRPVAAHARGLKSALLLSEGGADHSVGQHLLAPHSLGEEGAR